MIVEQAKVPYIRLLLHAQPWRGEHEDEAKLLPECIGTVHDLDWDGGNYWTCKQCGRISAAKHVTHKIPKMVHVARLVAAQIKGKK
jgi:hypothetical protein